MMSRRARNTGELLLLLLAAWQLSWRRRPHGASGAPAAAPRLASVAALLQGRVWAAGRCGVSGRRPAFFALLLTPRDTRPAPPHTRRRRAPEASQ